MYAVFRPEVAVDDSPAVRLMQGIRDLGGDPNHILERQAPFPPYPVPQRLAIHVRHGVPQESGGTAGIVKRDDVRVGQTGKELDLTLESLGAQHMGQVRVESLQGDGPVVLEVPGQEYSGHAAAP